jgi:hypothetical protein
MRKKIVIVDDNNDCREIMNLLPFMLAITQFAERNLAAAARLFFLQMEHALLGVYIHTKIAQEIETQEAGDP